MEKPKLPEPWLRGTLSDLPPVQRAVLHALELAKEDLDRWCRALTDAELNARPADIAPIAFHIRHVGRSTDRLLTYAEGNPLSPEQISAMKSELNPDATRDQLFAELNQALDLAATRIRAFSTEALATTRTVGGLLVHVADHAQRHVGQAITTAKIIKRNAWIRNAVPDVST
jgi:hypothetical protein